MSLPLKILVCGSDRGKGFINEFLYCFTKRDSLKEYEEIKEFDKPLDSQVFTKSVQIMYEYIEENATSLIISPNIVLYVFDVTNAETFKKIDTAWFPKISKTYPSAITILVGVNTFKRDSLKRFQATVHKEEGRKSAEEKMGLYLECKNVRNIDDVLSIFEKAVNYYIKLHEKPILKVKPQKKRFSWFLSQSGTM